MNEINWTDKNKRRWAFLIYKRLEMCQDELLLTHEILASLGAPRMDKLSKEFKLKGEEEKQLNKWVSS